jgi:dienelactone hydrolase
MRKTQVAQLGADLRYAYEGFTMRGRFFRASDVGLRPGVVVLHGAAGLTPFIEASAERIAELGYAALAADLWGGGDVLTEPSKIGLTLGKFAADREMWMGRIEASRAALATQPGVDAKRIAVLGYCFGGSGALEFARTGGAVVGAVSFHAGLDMVSGVWNAAWRGKVLICAGAEDPMAKSEDLARLQVAMSTAAVDWEVDLYGGVKHGFTEPDRPGQPPFAAYDARADRRSWDAARRFLAESFAA